jgi:outer membrane lipoprotein-sorting protein
MKKSVFICGVCALVALTSVAAAQTVDEIVAGNLEAKGGEQAWLDVQTMKSTGRMLMGGGAAGSVEMPFAVEFKRPDKVRLEFTMQGMTAVQAFDGETGWTIMPFLGKPDPEVMAEDQLKDIKNMAEFDGVFVNYKEKGHTIEFLGKEEVDGTPAYKLKVTRADGDVDTVYLDEEYFVEFRVDSKREVQGNEVEATTIIGDYKEVEGLMIAHSMEMSFGGEGRQVITMDSIEIGLDIPDERFTMPEKAESEETTDE